MAASLSLSVVYLRVLLLFPLFMRDGLYRVCTPHLCAGFVVLNGRITRCAPVLRKRTAYWRTIAVLCSTQDAQCEIDSNDSAIPLPTAHPAH